MLRHVFSRLVSEQIILTPCLLQMPNEESKDCRKDGKEERKSGTRTKDSQAKVL